MQVASGCSMQNCYMIGIPSLDMGLAGLNKTGSSKIKKRIGICDEASNVMRGTAQMSVQRAKHTSHYIFVIMFCYKLIFVRICLQL